MISLAVGFGILFILSMAERSIVAREIVFNSKTLLLLFKNTMGLQGIIEIKRNIIASYSSERDSFYRKKK